MSEERKVVRFSEYDKTLEADSGSNLLELIRAAGLPMHADCGGVGRCGKCQVIVNGRKRLACRLNVVEDMEVSIPGAEGDEGYAILLDGGTASAASDDFAGAGALTDGADLAIAIDIGTTTVVGKLLSLIDGSELASFAHLNNQLPYGADVISRINASLDDSSELSALITAQVDSAVAGLLAESGADAAQVRRVIVAGNATMSYILLGLPCRSLGFVPFKPAFDYPIYTTYGEVFKTTTLNCECVVLPFISAYVGGDLTAGLCALGAEDDFILMDMGTNGEMIFKRGERMICTATAAGPAFEGGNIECGCGSTRGAVSAVSYEDGIWEYKTIGTAPPTGICGSGILDLTAALVQSGLVDESGLMDDSLDGRVVLATNPELAAAGGGSGEVFFTQKDVRQFQLAKSATRCGLEIIMDEMGGDLPKKVFLAGGFGQNLNPQSAIATGMLPASFDGRVRSIGNSSLSGAVKVCLNTAVREAVGELAKGGEEINLAAHPRFNDLFMDCMFFN
jgi:uncharacterized 2Fe-2S/4Fe-4S cluster protein (DUF4445 family)